MNAVMQEQSRQDVLCGLCRTVEQSGPSNDVDYGTIGDIQKRQGCPLCRLILQMIPAYEPFSPTLGTQTTQASLSVISGTLNDGLPVFYGGKYLGSITSDLPAYTSSKMSPLKPHLIKQWINECESLHQDDLTALAPRYKHHVEIILVDVLNHKLVRASSGWRFLTISYVWGKEPIESTTTANRKTREQQGALLEIQIPQLILDAMLLVSQLGEQYLWVDCLCIEQDNPSQKYSQILQMDVIYSQSLLTLIALSSENVASYLPGVHEGTRSISRARELVVGRYLYATYPRLLELVDLWASSATSEERIFTETFKNIFELLKYSQELNGSWTGKFRIYASLVHEYSKRQLSYNSDVLNAFSGINAVLEHSLGTSSISGLLGCILDACLLWVPGKSSNHVRNSNFPSWSWAGWNGEIVYFTGPLYKISADPHDTDYLVMSMVERFDTSFISPLRQISRILQHQIIMTVVNEVPEKPTKGIDLLIFEAAVADMKRLKLYPKKTVVKGDIYSATLTPSFYSVAVYELIDVEGHRCGFMHYSQQMISAYIRIKSHLELVALSRNQFPSKRTIGALYKGQDTRSENHEILYDDKHFQLKPWCLVNFMLIEWKGSEAERLTIGQMHIDAWNRLKPQQKLIRLV